MKNIFRYREDFSLQKFVISRFFFIYFTISGVKIIVRYTEDVFKERLQYRGSSVHAIHYHEAFSFSKMLAKSKLNTFQIPESDYAVLQVVVEAFSFLFYFPR